MSTVRSEAGMSETETADEPSGDHAVASHTALIVPVPGAEGLCRLAEQFPRSRVTTGVAHITVATPFLVESDLTPAVFSRLFEVARSTPSFEFELSRGDAFPSGWVFLAPKDPTPFVNVREVVMRSFPAAGHHTEPHAEFVPHLSIYVERDADRRRAILEELTTALPVVSTAEELMLVRSGPDDWARLTSFPLGP